MFIAGDPLKGDCSREKACEFFDELFYEKLQMPSSYEANEGYSREEAIDKEVLPPATNTQFRNYYDEQMAKIDAENARKRRIDNLGFDPDDGNTIDVDDYSPAPSSRSVGQAQSSAVGMPKKIFYCVDFHCPADGMLGYSGGRGGRLNGRRRSGGYLRESDNSTPVSDIMATYKKLPEELKKDMEQIAAGSDGAVIVKHKGGEFTVVENGKPVMKRVSADEVRKSGKLGKKQVTVVTKDEIGKLLSEDDADPEKMMKEFVEKDADPEKMMKEFVEKKRKCGVEEDEYRRPKNQPHNLHQVDEGEDIEEDEDVEEDEYRRPKNQPHNLHSVDEGEDDELEDESEKPFELNESLVRFCDRLIRG